MQARAKENWPVANSGYARPMSPDRVTAPALLLTTCRALLRLRSEAAARSLAQLAERRYTDLADDDQRRTVFIGLRDEFAADPTAVASAIETWRSTPDQANLHRLWRTSEAPRLELFRALHLADRGIETLLAMRADLLRLDDPSLRVVEADLAYLLGSWFNRGFLTLRSIDWQTPAETLEKLIEHEAVHEIRGWDDLRRRLADDRRCFAFFHPSLPREPLIFVEIALTSGLATRITDVLDAPESRADAMASNADTAIFYSITNCQPGLRAIPLGDILLKQVIERLRHDVPGLHRFATLSPVPGLRRWAQNENIDVDRSDTALHDLTATYLLTAKREGEPLDPVARFHLRNGARLERINPGGDPSPKGERESFGVLVNYLYDLDTIADNHEAYLLDRRVAHAPHLVPPSC